MFLQRLGHGLQHKRRECELDAFGFVSCRKFLAQFAEFREIRIVKLRDARDGAPAFGHAPRDDLAQRRERFF